MKKLNKLVLNKAKIMTVPEMKHITGGYNGDSRDTCQANGGKWICCRAWNHEGCEKEHCAKTCEDNQCGVMSDFYTCA